MSGISRLWVIVMLGLAATAQAIPMQADDDWAIDQSVARENCLLSEPAVGECVTFLYIGSQSADRVSSLGEVDSASEGVAFSTGSTLTFRLQERPRTGAGRFLRQIALVSEPAPLALISLGLLSLGLLRVGAGDSAGVAWERSCPGKTSHRGLDRILGALLRGGFLY